MDELREKIALLISSGVAEYYGDASSVSLANDVLAIPEIAEALKELAVKRKIEAHFAETRDERRFLGHSISTNPPD